MILNERDNVFVDEQTGYKLARREIAAGERVVKYGLPIGRASRDIRRGEVVHTGNLKSALDEGTTYRYLPKHIETVREECGDTFFGYPRANGDVGIRNEVWIVGTVGCVNGVAQELARRTGAFCFPHPYGCSQLGGDLETTRLTLRGLIRHPNAGGVLVLGLGCENNQIDEMRDLLGDFGPRRVRFLNCQDSADEVAEGVELIRQLRAYADESRPREFPVSRLRVGLKCGGSDAFSGLVANPLVGRVCDRLTAAGASAVLTEIPETFGAEGLLTERCASEEVYRETVRLIEGWKDYYRRHGQPIYENPSPGNKAGGITTLEEKSIGCVQKSGTSAITDVLRCGQTVRKSGVSLLDGPGNDLVSVTNLCAAGVHLILFTTGRGTPLGAPVPTLKIASNAALAQKKPGWIDFDASPCLADGTWETQAEALYRLTLRTASGEPAKNERNRFREIAIFKDGVTL